MASGRMTANTERQWQRQHQRNAKDKDDTKPLLPPPPKQKRISLNWVIFCIFNCYWFFPFPKV